MLDAGKAVAVLVGMPSSKISSRLLPVPALRSAMLGLLVLPGLLGGCTPQLNDGGDQDSNEAELNRVPARVTVEGKSYDVETEYLPRVVMCENPNAPTEALRAQAIAARTFLTYKYVVEGRTSIRDGQADQVFTCPSNKNGTVVSAAVRRAVEDTAGKIVLHGNTITAGFFVAGANRNSACAAGTDPTRTEKYVTINVGRTGSKVKPSSIGHAGNPSNRGAMSQLLANCLANRNNYNAGQLLAYFYGADITLKGEGPISAVPIPNEDDPAVQPAPEPDPTDPPEPSPNDPTCFSHAIQQKVGVGVCVQSLADANWWQCLNTGGFGAVTSGEGPAGPCTAEYALPSQ